MVDKSAAWFANRLTGIGGSDANILMSGDQQKIRELWEEKCGFREREDLEWVLPVQLGSVTEELNVRFFERATGLPVSHRNEEFRHARNAFMRCETDGTVPISTDGDRAIVECKHVNQFAKMDEVVAKYTAQATHNMLCVGVGRAYFSVFIGTMKHEWQEVTLDDAYAMSLLSAEEKFWAAVQSKTPPNAIAAPPAPVVPVRRVDMTGSNEWGSAAAVWLANKVSAKKFTAAVDDIKALVEGDVVEAYGFGISAKRNKAGSITISEKKANG